MLSGTILMTSLSAAMTAFAAEDEFVYPESVTEEGVDTAVKEVDEVLNHADLLNLIVETINAAQTAVTLPSDAENLRDLVERILEENVYNDNTVNQIINLTQIELNNLISGIDLGNKTLNSILTSLLGLVSPTLYRDKIIGDYQAKTYLESLKAGVTWNDVDWTQMIWGIEPGNKDQFYAALGDALNAMSNVLKLILADQDYTYILPTMLKISAVKGYEKVVIPLFDILGVKGYVTAEQYNSEKGNTEKLIRNIIEPLLDRVLEICDAPATEVLNLLPRLAEFINTNQIPAILDSINITFSGNYASLVGDALTGMGIQAEEDGSYNLGKILTAVAPDLNLSDINGLLKKQIEKVNPDFKWVDIDFASLSALKGDSGKVLVWVLEYAGQVINANADLIKGLVPANPDKDLAAIVNGIVDTVLNAEPGKIAVALIHFVAPSCEIAVSPYNYVDIEKIDFAYPEGVNYGKDAYAMAPAAIDTLLTTFVDLKATVNGLFTKDTINQVLGLYDTISANQTVVDVLKALGINTDFEAVKAAAQAVEVKDSASFIEALTKALSPFDEVLALVLAGEDYSVFGYTVNGMDNYNTVVIPLLEMLGCTEVMSYEEYQKAVEGGESPLKTILTQVMERLDEILSSPVDSLTKLLPNVAYFLDNNNLSIMVKNVLGPVDTLLKHVDIDIMSVINELLKAYEIPAIDDLDNDLAGLLNKVLGTIKVGETPLGIVLPAIDLHKLAGYGMVESYTSAMVIDGKNVEAKRIVADQADVTGAVLGYLYAVLADEGNMNAIMGLLGESGAMVGGILEGLLGNGEAGFTNALFELLGLPMKAESEENPSTGDAAFAAAAGAAVLAAGAVLFLSRKKKEN